MNLEALNLYKQQQENIIEEFYDFLRFQTISSSHAAVEQMDSCAKWLEGYLKKLDMEIEHWGESGKITLFAESKKKEGAQTLLLYGHYDVQPADPLDAWITPPFEPALRDGKIYARGACDDKGQLFYMLVALRIYHDLKGSFPLNIKLVLDSQEEVGSLTLSQFLKTKSDRLRADHVLIIDGMMEESGEPAVVLGARGIVAFRLTLEEAKFDLHSGLCGGIARNPAHAMVQLLSTLFRADGSINISGFYDEIMEPLPSERQELDLGFDQILFEKTYGFKPFCLDFGLNPLESVWLRPTLEINGIETGFAREGFKTIIPAKATAHLSCRLVPRQIPERIIALVKDHLENRAPAGIKMSIETLDGHGKGFRLSPHRPIVKKMVEIYEKLFEKKCKKILIGGSIPIAADLIEASRGDGLIIGLCKGEDAIHAPNESFSVDRFEKGFQSIYSLIELFEQ